MLRYITCVLAIAGWATGAELRAASEKPNIVLIMADDLGYESLGANGGDSYRTPHLDGMAAKGMRFDRCYVQPLCTPTRVQLMTGMSNIRNYDSFGAIDPNATTFANLLKEAGYATGIAGKWQLGRDVKLPQKLGFDEACLWQHTRRPSRYANPGLEYNGVERDFTNGEYGPRLVNDFALDFVTRHKDGPFFLYYPMMLTHAPFQPTPDSPEWDPKAADEKAGKNVKHFADMVAYMDAMVGELVAKLDELKIRDNTLVIFLGDNGTGHEVTSQLNGEPYPGGKGRINARGMHVPLVASWPGHIPAGKVNDDLIDSTDFLPTLCEAAGAGVPDSLTGDGQSFYEQLLGHVGRPRSWIYCWYAKDGGPRALHEFAMDKSSKLYRGGRFFDLEADPFEEHPLDVADLSGSQAEAAKALKEVMASYADARPDHLLKAPDVSKKKAGQQKKKNKKGARARRRTRIE